MPARRKKTTRRSSSRKSARTKSRPKASVRRRTSGRAKAPARKRAGGAARKKAAPARRAAPPRRAASPPSIPSGIGMMAHHFDYTTHDLSTVKRFYVDLLGFRTHNHDPEFNYLWVQTGQSSSLGFMPPMPQMGEASPAKEPTLYFIVKDVDRAYSDLSAKGMMFEGPPADMPWGHRVVSTTDPEGRRVMLATRKKM